MDGGRRARAVTRARLPGAWRIAFAASLTLAVVAAAFGLTQLGRARDATRDANSFRTVLATLGGTGFKVGSLQASSEQPVEGSVVAYESSKDQSFVVVFVRTPELAGDGSLLVSRSDGTTWNPGPIEFDGDGDAAVWWVTDRSIDTMTGLTVTAPDGSPLASAALHDRLAPRDEKALHEPLPRTEPVLVGVVPLQEVEDRAPLLDRLLDVLRHEDHPGRELLPLRSNAEL